MFKQFPLKQNLKKKSQTSYLYDILYSNHNKTAETEVKHTKICAMIKEYDTSIFSLK